MATSIPSFAKAIAVAFPSPLPPPVMIAFLFFINKFNATIIAIKAATAITTNVMGDVKTVNAALNNHVAAVAAVVAAVAAAAVVVVAGDDGQNPIAVVDAMEWTDE